MRTAKYILLLSMIGLWSCSVTKHIPAGESLYTGADIKIKTDSTVKVNKVETKALEEQIEEIIRPKPNSTIFGWPYKVSFYYLFGEPKKEKGFKSFFRKRFGEPPVLANKRAVTTSSAIIANTLENEGYFRSTATGELIIKGKKAKGVYTAYLKPRYTINQVQFMIKDSSIFQENFRLSERRSLLQENNPYRFEVIKLERERIDQFLKRRGFYFFRPDYLIIKADTNLNNNKVNLYVDLKPNVNQTSIKQYYINDIYVNTDATDTTIRNYEQGEFMKISDLSRSYKPRVFNDAIGFRSGMIYSSTVHDASLSRLINLRNFKFVRNRFELVPRSDSALIDVHYDMTPLKKKALRSEISGASKSNGLLGFQLGVNWSNRNMFGGAEMLQIGANVGTDIQVSGRKNYNLNNFRRYKATVDLSFPRFVIPFYKVNPARNQALPKTNLNLTYSWLQQRGVAYNDDSTTYAYTQYVLTSIEGSWGYEWRPNPRVIHTLTPFYANVVKPKNISEEFVDLIFNSSNPNDIVRYIEVLRNRLILGGQYNITFTPQQRNNKRHFLFLSGGVDVSGNMASLFAKKGSDETSPKTLFGIAYDQYVRLDGEVRYYYDLSPSLRLANRLVIGYGIPYGNSNELPQIKQYFVGGSNSMRAFRARSLGPGSYYADSLTVSIFGFRSFGDIKLEGNTELRYKATDYINLALFVDAGNVWLKKYNPATSFYDSGSQFGKDFYKQLAVGGGIGLRLDFSYIKLRFDLATPFRKPWLPQGERWVFKDIALSKKAWRQENLILNIAVDYPF
ncbi:BamA/TamA family outer membrane protein [Emticicia sp. BO119]|uniref:translocation and assembly module lipoprotein TamL n=1 Tax=Emticicia sp. BO119 TaxID=2757768 RepID=UPI0015F08174|nr:BamA/TamA family outer membrane protein [Emticicia sp. BO119]MBA4852204.1 BamA/TamA family outer membrane protein [Emticicia sp. BO119]